MTRKSEIEKILPSLNGMTWKDADEALGSRTEIHKRGDQLHVVIAVGEEGFWRTTGLRVELKVEDGVHRIYTS